MRSAKNKIAYYGMMISSFFGILLFNYLTPYMSDDFEQVGLERRSSLKELIEYGWNHYMNIHGRSNAQVVRKFILEQDVWVFNVINSIFFIILIQLIYCNVKKRKKYDVKLYAFITILVWIGSVEFGQTILWKTGAIHYLWTTTLILGFFTFYRIVDEKWITLQKKSSILIGLFVIGILAGWCNENTSGGLLLYVGIKVLIGIYKKRKIYMYQVLSVISVMTGLLIMVLAPGNRVRLGVTGETHTGVLALLSHFLKITYSIQEHFYWILILLLVISVIVALQKGFNTELVEIVLLVIVSGAICYALVVIPTPIDRVYFGAGIFLILACSQGYQLLSECDLWARILQYCLVGGLAITFFFTYVEVSAQLLRISLQYTERENTIFEQIKEGKEIIVVTPYEEIYRTEYSYIHDSDITADKDHWSNWLMSQYYGVKGIVMDEIQE